MGRVGGRRCRMIPRDLIERLPKTDLHVHLDGSLRPTTLLELGRAAELTLPFATAEEIAGYMTSQASAGLARYLEVFEILTAVLQTREALRRVAFELAEDAARENVRYMEVRFSPILHDRQGLQWADTVSAVLSGLAEAEERYTIRTGVILCGIRTISPERSLELAALTAKYKGQAVVGFDLAGAERDYPAKDHREAFYLIRNNNISGTVHAGEEFGPPSIHQALHYCGAHRIGHGTQLWQDADLMNYVNDHRIPLEICLTSNLQIGGIPSIGAHPLRQYFDAGLRVTLNTDNRLVSNTTVTDEFDRACRSFGLDIYDLRKILINGFKSAFLPYRQKVQLLSSAIDEMDRLFDERYPGIYRRLRTFL
ncbi:MAG: adenosine deaminase [Candidatus Eisenbacteria bacterium]|nr:adenosine deaminase [Candidatus Eisenbacteria bacterium]